MDKDNEFKQYGTSKEGNFKVIDSIGVPHPYCITSGHVTYAADHHSGILGEAAIEGAEKKGIKCGICKGELSYKEHEKALLVSCNIDFQTDKQSQKELHHYLLKIKEKAEAAGYAGFAFKRDF